MFVCGLYICVCVRERYRVTVRGDGTCVMYISVVQRNLLKTATCGPVLTDLSREAGCSTEVDYNALVEFGAKEVAA